MQCIKPCGMFWGGEYIIRWKRMLKGLNPYMEMETNIISTLPNYGIVGFGFGGGNQLVPLMHLGFCGILPLGLDHDRLVNSFAIWVLS